MNISNLFLSGNYIALCIFYTLYNHNLMATLLVPEAGNFTLPQLPTSPQLQTLVCTVLNIINKHLHY
jgi:hypothetical protein